MHSYNRVRYYIRARSVRFLIFFKKIEYYIENDFMVIGPLKSVEECMEHLTKSGVGIRDISLNV